MIISVLLNEKEIPVLNLRMFSSLNVHHSVQIEQEVSDLSLSAPMGAPCSHHHWAAVTEVSCTSGGCHRNALG